MRNILVKNCPSIGVCNIDTYKYAVVRDCDGVYWYYGVYNDVTRAADVASSIGNGVVVETRDIVRYADFVG